MGGEGDVLNIAEVPYEDGRIRFRFSRRLSDDGMRWVRHGWFTEFHPNSSVASEGEFEDDLESGLWREFYDSGVLAAEGEYRHGKEHGRWRFWNEAGTRENDVVYFDGVPIDQKS